MNEAPVSKPSQAKIYQMLANPVRLEVLKQLVDVDECGFSALRAIIEKRLAYDVSQTVLSFAIGELRKAGLIEESRKVSHARFYRATDYALALRQRTILQEVQV